MFNFLIKGVTMAEPFFINSIFLDYILPFVLVFTLIFAILQKTQVLGEGKKQIDAIMGLVIGLILIAFPFSRNIIVQLMPFLAVVVVVLLVFMLIYGMVFGKWEVTHVSIKIIFGIVLAVGVLIMVLIIAGWWAPIYDYLFSKTTGANIWINVLILAVLVGAVVAVLRGSSGEGK